MLKSHFNLQPDEEEEEALLGEEEEGLGDKFEEEEVAQEHFEERRLEKSEISVRLSLLGKIADADGYAFLKAKCTEMNLTNIVNIKCFKHLQYVDFSNNCLSLEALQPVTELPYIVLVKADRNAPLTSAALKKTKYMQVIIMNHNKITTVHDVYQPELSTLDVGYNKITKVSFLNRMPKLRVLDFHYNMLTDIEDFNFPNLDSLYLAGNKISRLDGLEMMPNLRVLHVRNNPIRFLNGFTSVLKKLQYVNLRNCKVGTLKQVKKLKDLPALNALILRGCPYMGGTGKEDPENAQEEEDPETRVEVLAALPRLKRLNKAEYTEEEIQEAKDLMTQWLEEGEKEEEEEVDEQLPEEEQNDEEP